MKKKILWIALGLFGLLIVAAISIPFIFKDKIKAAIDRQIAAYVAADVQYRAEDFSLSLFKSFPDITASLQDFSIIDNSHFKGDTLLSVASFAITIDIWSVLFGDEMNIQSIRLQRPSLWAQADSLGHASWDILREQPADSLPKDEAATPLKINIRSWRLEEAHIIYQDHSLPLKVTLAQVSHQGKGALDADIFDLITKTEVGEFSAQYGGVEYLSRKQLRFDMTLGMDMAQSKYTFKDNSLRLNDFSLEFEGFVAMPDSSIEMDMRYKTPKNDFKALLSLVPGIYTESFKDLKSSGTLQCEGFVKGTYNAITLPAFGLRLLVEEGRFQYPDLPTAVQNIGIDLNIENQEGILDKTRIHLKRFHAELGKNPIDATALLEGLGDTRVDANVKARLNLAEMLRIFPVAGLSLKGVFQADVVAKGIYGPGKMPVVNATMQLQEGYVKSKDLPAPLEQISLQASLQSDGSLPNSSFQLQQFRMLLEGESLEAQASVKNFEDPNFDLRLKGGADLGKLTRIYPIEGMKLGGKVFADLNARGKMSDIQAGEYEKVPTVGYCTLQNFSYESAGMPPVGIRQAKLDFNPKELILESFEGNAGKSQMRMTGTLSNYMGYVFRNETIKGKLIFESALVDVNEWMPASESNPTDSSQLSVVLIPKNIDFVLNSTIDKVLYDNLALEQVRGNVIVREGTVRLEQMVFKTLGGEVLANGLYDTRDTEKPRFDFDFGIQQMAIEQAIASLVTMEKIAPLARAMTGKFSTKLKLNGDLQQNMMPVFNSLSGAGLVNIIQSTLKDAPVISKLSGLTKLSDLNPMQLKDVLMQLEIKDGRVRYKPFKVQAGKYEMMVDGSNGLDGSLDYLLQMDIPAGAAGQQVNSALASLTGQKFDGSEKIKLNINVGGLYKSPTLKIAKGSTGDTAKDALETKKEEIKNQLNEAIDEKKKEAEEKARAEAERLKAEAEEKARLEAERLKKLAEEEAKKKLKEKLPFKFP